MQVCFPCRALLVVPQSVGHLQMMGVYPIRSNLTRAGLGDWMCLPDFINLGKAVETLIIICKHTDWDFTSSFAGLKVIKVF